MSSPEKFWQGLASAMRRPDIFADARFCSREARIIHYEQLVVLLREIFAGETRAVWCARLTAEDVPHAPMYDVPETLNDAQVRHLRLEVAAPHPHKGTFRSIRFPITFDGRPALEITAPPLLNADGEAIRSALKNRK
jgi:crotonobetainyl-CoA:carnitine CoA-transferase CaiB-like acyl-CoA transferase